MEPKELKSKLWRSFELMENVDIVGRGNMPCCQSCGLAEILESRDEDAEGYVFWHKQDDQSIEAGRGCYLNYGSFGERTNEQIAEAAIYFLKICDLKPTWDGSVKSRIHVTG